MTIKLITTINVEAEPLGYHSLKPNQHAFAVHLSFEVQGATTEEEARGLFKTMFFDTLQNEFKVYKINIDNLSIANVNRLASSLVEILNKKWLAAFENWLSVRTTSFNSEPTSEQDLEIIDGTTISASHLIRATGNWDAPIPHKLRLSFIAIVEGFELSDNLWAIAPDGSQVDDTVELSPLPSPTSPKFDRDVTFTINTDGAPTRTFVTHSLAPLVLPENLLESGFLKASKSSEDDVRALKRLEERAASLLWTLPQLLEVMDYKEVAKDRELLRWLAKAGAYTALDPLLIALHMPGLQNEGQVLSVWISKFLDQARDLQGVVGEKLKAIDALQFRAKTRSVLSVVGFKNDEPWSLCKHVLNLSPEDVLVESVALGSAEGDIHADFEALFERLRTLFAQLQDESGGEAAVLRLWSFKRAEKTVLDQIANECIPDLGLNTDELKVRKTFFDDLFDSFKTHLMGSYNGAEAIRRSCGQVFANALTTTANSDDSLLTVMRDGLNNSHFFASRLGLGADKGTLDLLEAVRELLLPVEPPVNTKLEAGFKKQLNVVIADLFPDDAVRRFVPDSVPMPLPIRIASNWKPETLELFNRQFNGFGVLIRREAGPWTQACLARLNVYRDSLIKPQPREIVIEDFALHPFIPVVSDGRAESFIEYHGFPLATQAFSATGNEAAEDAPKDINAVPFYALQDADFAGRETSRPPTLAYGASYATAAFAVSMSGSLPSALQINTALPWYPKLTGIAEPEKAAVSEPAIYQRRTAIGRTTIQHDERTPADQRRIGAKYENVFPLSGDYPRLVLSSLNNCHIDILRNSDGTGGLNVSELEDGENPSVVIDDLTFWSAAKVLKIDVFSSANTVLGGKSIFSGAFPAVGISDPKRCIVSLKAGDVDGAETTANGIEFTLTHDLNRTAVWLRLTTPSGVISFAKVESDQSDKMYSNASAPPVLLLAPKLFPPKDTWKPEFSADFKAKVVLPRVGYLDFEHWLNNASSSDHLVKDWPEATLSVTPDPLILPDLKDILLYAYLLRAMSPVIANLIERLPDPAVTQMLVELAPSDTLTGDPLAPKSAPFNVRPLNSGLRILRDKFALPSDISLWQIKHYVAFLEHIDERATVKMCANSDVNFEFTLGSDEISVSVPAGLVANLSIRPRVAKKFIGEGKPMHAGHLQLAIGETAEEGGHYVFDGAILTIEAMIDSLDKVTAPKIEVKTTATERAYELVGPSATNDDQSKPATKDDQSKPATKDDQSKPATKDDQSKLLRIVSDMDVHTQRWRFSGRPIYNWLAPKEHAVENQDPKAAAIELDSEQVPVKEFEDKELFALREKSDFASVRKHLEPLPTQTVLQKISWNDPTATYFRHRFSVYSRYRGAMLHGKQVKDFDPPNKIEWTQRIAMLADANRIGLPRPQVRAIIPMTSNPGAPGASPESPPLLAVLEERPFSYGGLAERVLAGIDTGIGYGFASKDGIVAPQDLRKELGKDPRLTVLPFDKDAALAAGFSVEGPIGLHFDRAEVKAPAWSNSQWVLQPEVLKSGVDVKAESFLAVRMLRILDPAWLMDAPKPADFDLNKPWQASFGKQKNCAKLGSMRCDGVEVCKVSTTAAEWIVEISAKHLDITTDGLLKLCTTDLDLINRITLVHRPIGDGAYSLAVFGELASANAENGQSNSPKLLAAIDWVLSARVPLVEFLSPNSVVVSPHHGSAATARQWARTARPANQVFVNGAATPTPIASLALGTGGLVNNKSKKTVQVGTEPPEAGVPQTLHRHLVAVFTKRAPGLGRPVDVFHSAKLLTGGNWIAQPEATSVRLGEIHVPARPIVGGLPGAPERFKKVLFDLRSIRAKIEDGWRFHIRFVVPSSSTLTLKLGFTDIMEHSELLAAGAKTLDFCLLRESLLKRTSAGWEKLKTFDAKNFGESISLEISTKNEFWADVSILPIFLDRGTNFDDFDDFAFDWLFTNKGGNQDVAGALSKRALAEDTFEAAAQLVSWSDPIRSEKLDTAEKP